MNGGFTNTSNLNCPVCLNPGFPLSSPGQYTLKILTMHKSMPFFFKLGEGQLRAGCGKRSSILLCYCDLRSHVRKQTQKLRFGKMIPVVLFAYRSLKRIGLVCLEHKLQRSHHEQPSVQRQVHGHKYSSHRNYHTAHMNIIHVKHLKK